MIDELPPTIITRTASPWGYILCPSTRRNLRVSMCINICKYYNGMTSDNKGKHIQCRFISIRDSIKDGGISK
jgi:hypothetical protein